MRRAVYPGSFDPFTKGHLNVVEKAAKVFDEVVIAIAKNVNKKQSLLPGDLRVELAKKSVEHIPNVTVYDRRLQHLMVHFCKEVNAGFLIRGLRGEQDIRPELTMNFANHRLDPEIQTVFFACDPDYAYISSTLVREIYHHKGNIEAFVPKAVLDVLQKVER